MTHFGYIVAAYGLTAGMIGGYALWMRARHRALLAFDAPTRGTQGAAGEPVLSTNDPPPA